MARNSFRRPAPDAFDREYLQTMESLMAADARANPRQDEILGLSGYRARVLYPKFEDGGGVNSGSLSAADGRARVRGSLFTRDINFLSNRRGGKKRVHANPRRDELLAIAGYDARVLWPKYSATGGVNSGNASYIPRSVGGSLFDRDINLLSNTGVQASAHSAQTFLATTRKGQKKNVTVHRVLAMPQFYSSESVREARRLHAESQHNEAREETLLGYANPKHRHNPSKDQKAQALAQQVVQHWPKVSPYAEQQLFFMLHPDMIMGGDRIEHVIASFLANANGWRGDKAREIKAELKKLL